MTKIQFTATRAALLPAFDAVKKAVARKATIPVLSNLLVEVSGGRATLVGTDLDAEASTAIDVGGATDGAFTLPFSTFSDAVRKLPDGAEVQVSTDGARATIVSGRSRFTLPVLPASDFPRFSGGSYSHSFALASTRLSAILDRVRFAVSTEETRYYLNGIFLEAPAEGGQLIAVATDSHRLARVTLDAPDGADGMPSIILPRTTLDLLEPFVKAKGDIAVSLSDTKIRFEADGTVLVSKLVDGTFPDYRRVIPTGNGTIYTVERAALAASLDRLMTMHTARGTPIKAAFDGGALALATTNPDSGEASDEVACEQVAGDAIEIGFNGRYTMDMLGATEAERIRFRLGDPGSPMMVEPVDQDDTMFVLMPMRV